MNFAVYKGERKIGYESGVDESDARRKLQDRNPVHDIAALRLVEVKRKESI